MKLTAEQNLPFEGGQLKYTLTLDGNVTTDTLTSVVEQITAGAGARAGDWMHAAKEYADPDTPGRSSIMLPTATAAANGAAMRLEMELTFTRTIANKEGIVGDPPGTRSGLEYIAAKALQGFSAQLA